MDNFTRTTSETKIAKLIGKGDALQYTVNLYDQETLEKWLELPDALATLATNCPDAEVIEFGDGLLGIEISGKIWATEMPNPHQDAAQLPHEVWQYLNLAMGREYDGVPLGNKSVMA